MNFFEREWKTGFQVEDYVVKSLLGKGSYGTAYLVENITDGRLAVIKRLRPYKRLIDPSGKLLFREADILNRLESAHFPKLISVGKQGKVPYLIMDFFEGKTVDQLIFDEGKSFDEKESLTLVKEVVEVVSSLHVKGIVHRDLRIPNVILSEGTLKIIDFGLAVEMENNDSGLLKHRDYMREKSVRADFYALGHFLLFLLYSSYKSDSRKEKSWEDELDLTPPTKEVLRKLLQIEQPFADSHELLDSLEEAIRKIQK
ncbi:serine/threonine protein kinase [Bacillus sp. SG-1]|uniref:serine/threonine protein kinase n=1 Tax=Bacillus sp. SG-1 TaxID=161544 RepID=UPI0018DE4B3A|nr:protein kinase [Bacillus sp. SG-1]